MRGRCVHYDGIWPAGSETTPGKIEKLRTRALLRVNHPIQPLKANSVSWLDYSHLVPRSREGRNALASRIAHGMAIPTLLLGACCCLPNSRHIAVFRAGLWSRLYWPLWQRPLSRADNGVEVAFSHFLSQ